MAPNNWHLPWEQYVETLKPHERPMMPGSPATPDHSWPTRIMYAVTGLMVATVGSLGNGAITANVQNLQGSLGITVTEAAWLPVVFVMTNACMNLILVKFRMQYGLRLFTQIFLGAFVLVCAAHLFVDNYQSTLLVRAIAGMAGAGLSSLGFLYLIQAFPAAHRLKGLIIGIGLTSFAVPIARLIMPGLLQLGDWRAFYLYELGMCLIAWGAVQVVKLPPSEKMRVFDRLDFVTFALFAPGVALLCAVLGLGRIVWWTEAPWLGWAMIGAIVLLTAAFVVEYNRANPLINIRWLTGADMLRLFGAILLIRMVLSEQTSGAVGFLTVVGLGPDQLMGLFGVILAAMVAGTAVSAFTLNMEKLNKPIAIALGLIAIGAFMDSHSTLLTRPAQLYVSQALIAFASAMFIGPALMQGVVKVLTQGKQNLISFIVMFSVLQNVGGLAGSALTGSLQIIREKFHSNQLAADITSMDPQVVLRLRQLSGAYSSTITDPALLNAEGAALLGRQVTQQANVLAYNDVFLIISMLAAIGCVWVTITHLRPRWKAKRDAQRAAQQAPDSSAVASAVD
ncbi:MFS transporter [Brevundimonas nasdae]|uniref:MFS transporter n=1 Tax=Brevundimonas nasdae TaxID=172043 RepID=A0ABX8TCV3_9CAUL|nr:MFS transporter [Brevundimonas nasdae]QYC09007.1 MFS transporter [Brevundimonas nasdae]QYC15057.1 MFS transporter [Brevundimonas nasdae]